MSDVRDLPLWQAHPFKVPSYMEVRFGKTSDFEGYLLALWAPEYQMQVDCQMTKGKEEIIKIAEELQKGQINHMVSCLAGGIFEKLYPGYFNDMIKEEARAILEGRKSNAAGLRRKYNQLLGQD